MDENKRLCDMSLDELLEYRKTHHFCCGVTIAPVNFLIDFRQLEKNKGETPISGEEFLKQLDAAVEMRQLSKEIGTLIVYLHLGISILKRIKGKLLEQKIYHRMALCNG